eukprot:TRINITY_DN4619_c0_g1_i1.p1 TRINITY_DN4619_c0_g1~~TRINITY_DN4619_c0_g1_i1.p1  ORF type:complete len:594 (+),score=133.04 TRINITY_DN4619_c0_g1_i1:40-1782(+)
MGNAQVKETELQFVVDPKKKQKLVIGRGVSGMVLLARYQKNLVAVKYFRYFNEDICAAEELQHEKELLSKLSHPNLIGYHGVNLAKGFIVMEYVPMGDLFSNIRLPEIRLEAHGWSIMEGIAAGLAYLHSKNIMHLDLKSQNVLLHDQFVPKISDFGLSKKVLSKTPHLSTVNGKFSLSWAPPENFEVGKKRFTFKSDVYSLAIIFNEILTGLEPWGCGGSWEIPKKVLNKERPEIPASCPPALRELIVQCWQHDPTKRLASAEVKARIQELRKGKGSAPTSSSNMSSSPSLPSSSSSSRTSSAVSTALQSAPLSAPASKAVSTAVKDVRSIEIPDPEVKRFWVDTFGTAVSVDFEQFYATLRNKNILSAAVQLSFLREIIDPKSCWSISLTMFWEAMEWLGPLSKFGSNVLSMQNSKWFVGFRTREQAATFLEGKKPGTYLIRLRDGSPPSSGIALSMVKPSGDLGHFLIHPRYIKATDQYVVKRTVDSQNHFQSIQELLDSDPQFKFPVALNETQSIAQALAKEYATLDEELEKEAKETLVSNSTYDSLDDGPAVDNNPPTRFEAITNIPKNEYESLE